ncbi:LOW QUALITY PROTEIN: zinc finger protein 414-like [Tautogolabrus adspersus]
MMSLGSTLFGSDENGNGGKQRTLCPLHGCKRVYTDTSSLETHIKDHEIPAESLPGKVFLCSSIGCGGSFLNMQKLMEHMRHHHKPNIYFLCENCRTKLRTYKGLLTHLHTCSKVSQGKTKLPEPMPPPSSCCCCSNKPKCDPHGHGPGPTAAGVGVLIPATSNPKHGRFLPCCCSSIRVCCTPSSWSPILPNPDPSPPQLAPQQLKEAALLPQLINEASEMPPSLNIEGASVVPDATDTRGQNQAQSGSLEPTHAATGSSPLSPPPLAVWRKNQAQNSSRRVLWEHTRGRYTCLQCGHTVTNRKDMSQHISSQHSGNKPAEDTESSAATS